MKRKNYLILVICSIVNGTLIAQPTLDSTNNATNIGDQQMYYVADSNAVNLSAVTGASVTWDYSALSGTGFTADNLINNVNTSAYSSDYTSSTIEDALGSSLLIFKTNYGDSIVSQGYVFNDPNYGTIKIILSNHLKLMSYPFTYGSSFSDNLSGSAFTAISAMPIPYEGTVDIDADGYGTLLLGSNTYSNVLRVKVSESSVIDLGTATVPVERVQYLYFEPGTGKFPVFMHTTISANGVSQTAVFSRDSLPVPVGIRENTSVVSVYYPNPASGQVYIETTTFSTLATTLFFDVIDLQGRVIRSTRGSGKVTVPLDGIAAGTYVLHIHNENVSETHELVVY